MKRSQLYTIDTFQFTVLQKEKKISNGADEEVDGALTDVHLLKMFLPI